MFDPAALAAPEVAAARDRAFAVIEGAIGNSPNQQERDPDLIHKVALAVWACSHGAASMMLADPTDTEGGLMEDVIQGLEALFRRR